MRLLHCGAIVVAGLMAFATAVIAQEPDTLSPAQRAGRALARLGAGQPVRIITREDQFIEGSLVTTSPSLVTVRTDRSVIEIPVPSVDSLWVRRGTHAGKGALIGAVPGLAFLGAVLVTSGGPNGEARDIRNFTGAITGLLVLGGGMVVGAIIGAASPDWQLQAP
ncbi:MAG TPA: hypothetical protein VEU73_03865 [Gemmatimonadales bacterium]|nr:hypothetical protein [Gemmatimonadales bacterium]